jgi:hypothetical protein
MLEKFGVEGELWKGEPFWSYLDCFQWPLSTVCLQGFYNIPSSTSPRILVAVGSLAGVLIYGAYSGTLISFLSVVIEPINNLGQLIDTDYTFVVADEPLALKFLAVNNPEIHAFHFAANGIIIN